jgi:hypothetical protein
MGMIDGGIQHLSVDLVRESFTHQHLALARHLIWYRGPPPLHRLPGAKNAVNSVASIPVVSFTYGLGYCAVRSATSDTLSRFG